MLLQRWIALAISLLAALAVTADDTVTSVADLKRLFRPGQKHIAHFVLTGTVTHVSATEDATFVLRDKTGVIQLHNNPHKTLKTGSIVVARGHTIVQVTGEPWTSEKVSLTSIGYEPLPVPPKVGLAELDAPKMDLQTVCITATVIDILPDDMGPGYDFILLKEGPAIIPAVCRHDPNLHKLIDSQVCMTGLVQHALSSYRKFTSPFIFVDGPADIAQVSPPPADPFAFPPLPLDLYVSPQRLARLDKHSVTGTVLAAWQPNNVLIQTDLDRILRLTLCKGEKLPEFNVPCTAVGYPASDTYHVNLMQARIRVDGERTSANDVGENTTPENVLLDEYGSPAVKTEYHGKLISLTGIVKSAPASSAEKRQLLLNCGKLIVPVDFSVCPDAAQDIPIGSTIEATGRCVLEIATWQPNDVLPRISGMLLVTRHKGDLRIVVPPPWLTVGKLLIIVSLLLAALLAVFIRNRILKRIGVIRLNDRTQLAVELHDSLSQSLAGIAYQITAAQRDADQASAEKKLATADQMLQSCRVELKNCLFDLRNDTIADQNLNRAIRRTLEKFGDQADISIRFNVSRAPFGDSTVHAVLTIIRELVSNAVQHGQAETIRIAGEQKDGAIRFSVRDDGCGFDPSHREGPSEGHFGLSGVNERVRRLGGQLEIQSSPGKGTRVLITLHNGGNK